MMMVDWLNEMRWWWILCARHMSGAYSWHNSGSSHHHNNNNHNYKLQLQLHYNCKKKGKRKKRKNEVGLFMDICDGKEDFLWFEWVEIEIKCLCLCVCSGLLLPTASWHLDVWCIDMFVLFVILFFKKYSLPNNWSQLR